MSDEKEPTPSNAFKCPVTDELLYMPVVTTDGVAYSYLALFEIFAKAQGVAKCVVTDEPLEYFPGVCKALHYYLTDKFPEASKVRQKAETKVLMEEYGLGMPNLGDRPDDDTEEGFMELMSCAVDEELAFEPCALSSGNIVSAHNIPEDGFKKDPDRLTACALHGQIPQKSSILEVMIKDKFPQEFARVAREAPPAKELEKKTQRDTQERVFWGLGCDACGQWPIRKQAWYDPDCKDKTGFNLCDGCYQYGVHKRVMTGRFNQKRLPTNQMLEVQAGEYF